MILQRCTHPHPCYDDGKCHYKGECSHKAPLTNADRIRSMNDEELTEFLIELADDGNLRIREWLQQPVDEDDHDERKENENV